MVLLPQFLVEGWKYGILWAQVFSRGAPVQVRAGACRCVIEGACKYVIFTRLYILSRAVINTFACQKKLTCVHKMKLPVSSNGIRVYSTFGAFSEPGLRL